VSYEGVEYNGHWVQRALCTTRVVHNTQAPQSRLERELSGFNAQRLTNSTIGDASGDGR